MAANLNELLAQLQACRHCAERFQKTKTTHEPNPIFQITAEARVCIAGQAPGLRAHSASKPFQDPSGDRLRDWLGLDKNVFYDPTKLAIVPMSFCFPGYNAKGHDLPPPPDCARLWRRSLFEMLPQIELIVIVGKSALGWHLPEMRRVSLGEVVSGGLIEGNPSIFPLPHPSWRNNSWLKANPWFTTDTLPLLRSEISRLVS